MTTTAHATRTSSSTRGGDSRQSGYRGNGSGGGSAGRGNGKPRKPPQTLRTWVFDSVGPRKYAIQVCKAGNGNPSIKIVEGNPQDDGTYRKFNIRVWSEDFEQFFALMDEMRTYLTENEIKTPPGHKYVPKPRKKT